MGENNLTPRRLDVRPAVETVGHMVFSRWGGASTEGTPLCMREPSSRSQPRSRGNQRLEAGKGHHGWSGEERGQEGRWA